MIFLADNNPDFVKAIKEVENNVAIAKKRGEYKEVQGEWLWFPGKSPEGGLPTLAWGHKLTNVEWETKHIEYEDSKLKQMVSKDFRYGITDDQAHALLVRDLCLHEILAKRDWDNYNKELPYEKLPDKYKGVLVNLTFNAGGLAKRGKFIWTTVQRGIKNNDDTTVAKGMVTSYKNPKGQRITLTTRAVAIAKALGLPWQTIKQ